MDLISEKAMALQKFRRTRQRVQRPTGIFNNLVTWLANKGKSAQYPVPSIPNATRDYRHKPSQKEAARAANSSSLEWGQLYKMHMRCLYRPSVDRHVFPSNLAGLQCRPG